MIVVFTDSEQGTELKRIQSPCVPDVGDEVVIKGITYSVSTRKFIINGNAYSVEVTLNTTDR